MNIPPFLQTRLLGPKEDLCPRDVQELVLSYLPLPDLVSLSKVPKIEGEVEEHVRSRVVRLLAKIGVDPEELLGILKKTGSVISGSAALEVVVPGTCRPNDLNLYCPLGKVDETSKLLLRGEAYETIQSPDFAKLSERKRIETFDLNNGVSQIVRFKHKSGVTVTLVESLSYSPLAPIFFFHNTILMNCITGDEVVSFYPYMISSLTGLKNNRSDRPSTHSPDKIKKWESLGFNIIDSCETDHSNHVFWNSTPKHGFCHREYRTTTDVHCARLAFSPVSKPNVVGPVLCWRLGYDVRRESFTTRNSPVVVISTTGWPRDRATKATARSGTIVWHTYTAPLLQDSETVDPCLWKRSFP
ncbi:hypothetical protein DFP72DRAFT_860423 [Ephemerocybe angulata]|uniref:Uncharacterized protein n=1 Tax=Ephemerocybe angulata TaxID=980116 RepID=A0A8H6LUB2_9AGAR|nr:hypothetical protein DFP72DRAFT_860423 [Tulosesus angulatus]